MGKLDNKVAVVTGANSGIGLAIARQFAAEGATVFLTGRRSAELDAAVAAIGSSAIGVVGDISSLSDLDRLYDTVREQAGRIDVLVANAGIVEFAPLGAIDPEHYQRVFDINVKGSLFTVQKALPLLSEGASVILTGSVVADRFNPAVSVYAASKATLRTFARNWSVELAPRGIRVNTLVVGPVATPGWDSFAETAEGVAQVQAQVTLGVPLGRMGQPEEVAAAALFLASSESSFVTGTGLHIDGGYMGA